MLSQSVAAGHRPDRRTLSRGSLTGRISKVCRAAEFSVMLSLSLAAADESEAEAHAKTVIGEIILTSAHLPRQHLWLAHPGE